MAWTQADVDAVREAVLKLATGRRTVSISFAGPPERQETYGIVDLPQLRELLAEMEPTVVGSSSNHPTYRLASTRKGL